MFLRSIFYIVMFSFFALHAEERFQLSGSLYSAVDSSRLAGANIYLAGTTIGTTTGEDGTFVLPDLPAARYTVSFSYIGYSEHTQNIDLTSGNRNIAVYLDQQIMNGPIVSVVATMARDRVSPVTFSSISKKDITTRYTVQDVPELLSELPSTTFYSDNGNGLGYNYLSIRGFGQRRISVMINGIPQNDPEDHNVYWIDFPDFMPNVQQIQVQRGAGSAFYGPAAIGGSINIQTNHFSPERQFKIQYGAGSYNTQKYSMTYNSGLLADRYVLYSRFSRMKSDGYRETAWIDFWSYFLGAARYTEKSSLRVHFYGGPIEDGLAYFGLPKSYNDNSSLRKLNYSYWQYDSSGDSIVFDQRRTADEKEHFHQPHFELLHEYRLSPKMVLNNNLFFIRGSGYFDYNGNWASPEYFRLTPEYGYDVSTIPSDAIVRAFVDNRQVGWLPNITWEYAGGELVAGAELRYHRSIHWGRLQKGAGLPEDVVGNDARRYYEYKGGKDMASLYLHETHYLTPSVILMADLQYAYKRYHLFDEKFLGREFDIPYHFLNPRLGLNMNLSSSTNWYINVSRTTREPRLKNLYDAAEASTTPWEGSPVEPQFEQHPDGSYNFDKPLVKPETLTDLEIGLGYRKGNLKGYANLFYMDFKDEIIKKGGLDRFGQPITGNAERTTHKGLELIAEMQLTPRISFNGNMMYSQNILESYSIFEGGEQVVLDGNIIAGFPSMLANARITYSWQGLYASAILKYVGKQYTDNFENDKNSVDPFTTVNLDFRYALNQIGIEGMVLQGRINNLLNKKYLMYGNGAEFFPAATRNAFISIGYEF